MKKLETSSHLTGVTVNPFNRLLTCGGGSGGQGALLGLRGGCLAVGKGDGVSFSSASASQGLYALRPSSCASRLRTRQSTGGKDKSIADSVGPMSTSLGGIKLFMRTVLERQSGLGRSDGKPHLHKIHARPELHVGVMWHDGIVQPHPPVQRALRSVCDRLARIDSIKLSPWQPYKHDEASRIVVGPKPFPPFIPLLTLMPVKDVGYQYKRQRA